MELGPNQTRWIEALKSGLYAQGVFALRRDDKFCCLGVACEIFGVPRTPTTGSNEMAYGLSEEICGAPIETIDLLQLWGTAGDDIGSQSSLATLNDNGHTFAEIATLLETSPERYFRSPA